MRCVSIITLILSAACLNSIAPAAHAQPGDGEPDWIQLARLEAAKRGITVGEAVRRAALMEKVQRANERFFNDPDYAGAVIVQDSRNIRAKFAFKGGKKPDLADQELKDISDITPAPRSLRDLSNARADLMRQLGPRGISAAFVEDIETQRLKLFPEDPAAFQRVVSELGIAIPDFIEVQSTPLVRQLQYDVYGSGDISYSGSTDNCTGGFNVTDGTVRGLSTAGHCSSPPPPASTHRGQPIGTLMPQISLIEDGNGLDVSWYRNPSFNYPNIVRKSSTVIYTVVASFAAPPPKYQPTCVLPRASPEACDEVFDFVYWYKRGTTVASDGPYVVTKGYITAQKDSGSPWMYNGYAHGIHAGVVAWAGATRSFYSPVSSLSRIGLRVVTTP